MILHRHYAKPRLPAGISFLVGIINCISAVGEQALLLVLVVLGIERPANVLALAFGIALNFQGRFTKYRLGG